MVFSNAILAKFPNLPEEDAKLESYMMLRYLYRRGHVPDSPEDAIVWKTPHCNQTTYSLMNSVAISSLMLLNLRRFSQKRLRFTKSTPFTTVFFEYTNADYIF